MATEHMQVLEMLSEGKVSTEQALELLKAISSEETRGRRGRGEWDFGFDKMGKMFDKLFGMRAFTGSADFNQPADLKGPVTIGGSARFHKDAKLTGPVTAGGGTRFHGEAVISGPVSCGGSLRFGAPAKIEAERIKTGGSLRFADKAEVSVKDSINVKRDLVLEPGAQL